MLNIKVTSFSVMNFHRKVYLLILFVFVVVSLLYVKNQLHRGKNKNPNWYLNDIFAKTTKNPEVLPKNTIQCYRMKFETLPDISEKPPRKENSIFFHETSCNSFYKGKITINARQACAVESAAILNPNLDVYLLYSSPGIFKFNGDESDKFLRALLSYENINIMYLDFEKHTKGTPVEELYKSGKLESSDYVVFHASDVIRFTTLWKYGGIYLDLDVIVIKPFYGLPLNFAGIERNDSVNSAILSFDNNGIGHILAKKCLNELQNNFNGKEWAENGPGLITRILQSTCGVTLAADMVGKNCHGFTVYPQNKFYPIPGPSWETLFDDQYLEEILKAVEDSYTIHLWNDISAFKKIPVTSINAPYLYFAKKFCPKVAKAINKYF